ncbi:hypothetical protein FB45DRAFT_1124499 [Roridomyces roridus]|uniref:F-box domain-containing protein n=1 Tax=Roridomyces roridus TaxID=1738132 RepID=A0AAD7FVW6_9AGAR|nr:hypothetical protein FB45DRAFT_1124499 [Roridomyces roridus]
MHLLDLAFDVLLRILGFLDVASVLKASSVCSSLRRLSQDKHVWIPILDRLRQWYPIPEDLAQYFFCELIAHVKRIVVGPRTWNAGATAPTLRRRLRIPMSSHSCPHNPIVLAREKHLLVGCGILRKGSEIWDVSQGRKVWANETVPWSRVAAQPLERGIVIALWTGQKRCVLAPLVPFPIFSSLQVLTGGQIPQLDAEVVLQISLQDSGSESLLDTQLPHNFPALADSIIDDEFWAADSEWYHPELGWTPGVLLVNWRERTFVLLSCSVRDKHLLQGNLLAMSRSNEDSQILLYPNSAFSGAWNPLTTEALAAASLKPFRVDPIVLQTSRYYQRLPSGPH